jgi:hypothetical protein
MLVMWGFAILFSLFVTFICITWLCAYMIYPIVVLHVCLLAVYFVMSNLCLFLYFLMMINRWCVTVFQRKHLNDDLMY